MKATQTERVLAFIRSHPEATSLEITLATGVVNVTGRVSDARAAGYDVVCETRSDGRKGYRVRERDCECGEPESAGIHDPIRTWVNDPNRLHAFRVRAPVTRGDAMRLGL